jgi:glutathione S-transferase
VSETHKKTGSVPDARPVLYQAEWCPFSSAVREILTELGIDFVEPWAEERNELLEVAGTDQIPVLQEPDGSVYRGTREIFAHLREREPWRYAAAHRRRYADHRPAREAEAPGRLIEHFRRTEELEAAAVVEERHRDVGSG